jgi:DNA-binding NtrC family response regulator
LNAVRINVPPLRQRLDEVEPLVRFFLARTRREWSVAARDIEGAALEALQNYGWPGNVRQLRYAVERTALLCSQELIKAADLPDYVFTAPKGKKEQPALSELADLALREHLLKYERALIDEAMRRAAGNRGVAAKLLRIPVRTLFRRMRMSNGGEGVAD